MSDKQYSATTYRNECTEYHDNGMISKRWQARSVGRHKLSGYCDKFYDIYEKHGDYKEWFVDGTIHVHCQYTDGKVNGWFTQYHENGMIDFEVMVVDDMNHGEYKSYDTDGNPLDHCMMRYHKVIESYPVDKKRKREDDVMIYNLRSGKRTK
jgi:antitoxin component YwqK of YwqJK toxin-antitoxin module